MTWRSLVRNKRSEFLFEETIGGSLGHHFKVWVGWSYGHGVMELGCGAKCLKVLEIGAKCLQIL